LDIRIGVPDELIRPAVLNAGLEAVTRLNEEMIKTGKAPDFHEQMRMGVKWKPEPPGFESFDHAGTTAKRGWGDCDDLSALHAGTLRATGEDPGAQAVAYKSGPHRWHAVTLLSDGTYRDPSQTAGMNVRKGSKTAGIPPAVVAPMASTHGVHGEPRPFVAMSRDATAYVGRTDLPFGRSGRHVFAVSCRAATPSKALAGSMKAATILGGCSGMCHGEHLDKLWALSGLLQGDSPRAVAAVVGVEVTKQAVRTIADLCPAVLQELRAHRAATESRGGSAANVPFDEAFDVATVGFSFGGMLHSIGNVVKGATGLIQGVVSLVPGIGTGISAAIGAGMTLLEGGSPIDIAINAAFGAIPIPPGARDIAHMALDAALKLLHGGNATDSAVAAARSALPSGLPQQVFDTLAHLILSHKRQRATTGIVSHPKGKPTKIVPMTKAAHFHALAKIAPTKIALVPLAPHPPSPRPPSRMKSHGAWVLA
jgi:hypothetical protein